MAILAVVATVLVMLSGTAHHVPFAQATQTQLQRIHRRMVAIVALTTTMVIQLVL